MNPDRIYNMVRCLEIEAGIEPRTSREEFDHTVDIFGIGEAQKYVQWLSSLEPLEAFA